MKITRENIKGLYPTIKGKLDKDLRDMWTDGGVSEMIDLYGEDKDIDENIDIFIDAVNKIIKTSEEPKMQKEQATSKQEKVQKEPKPKKEKLQDNSKAVSKVSVEVSIIKRYCSLNGKVHSEIKDKACKLLSTLQKAIVDKQIRKTSEYAKEINAIQDSLIEIVNLRVCSAELEVKNYDRLKEIALSEKVMPCASIVKSFLSIQGKTDVRDKAIKLTTRIAKFAKDAPNRYDYKEEIAAVLKSLTRYTGNVTHAPVVSSQMLNGLYSVAACGCTCETGQPISSSEFMGSVFSPMHLTGKWAKLIGSPSEPFQIMMYGKPGSGKSTLSLEFASYLAHEHNKKVLYIAHEEGFSYTFQEKLKRLNAAHPNLIIVDTLPKQLKEYDVIFMDSVNSMRLETDNLKKLDNTKSYVYIFQSTKDGKFRGSQEYEHIFDTTIVVENMTASPQKNRFGGKETVKVQG